MELFQPFERPIENVERLLRRLAWRIRQGDEPAEMEYVNTFGRRDRVRRSVYSSLTAWERVQLARHPHRPHGLQAAETMFGKLEPLRGDRSTGDDNAIVTGIGRWRGNAVVVIACERGQGTRQGKQRNFGMPGPAGFRKAIRALETAESRSLPVVSIVDTPGAYPGVESERMGLSESISRAMLTQARVRTPTLGIIIGEGGSGGALALAMADRMIMMEFAYFSVISPEACASILWRDGARTPKAAEALKLLPEDLLRLGIIDEVVQEPLGGAHRYPVESLCRLRESVDAHLSALLEIPVQDLVPARYERYRNYGEYVEQADGITRAQD